MYLELDPGEDNPLLVEPIAALTESKLAQQDSNLRIEEVLRSALAAPLFSATRKPTETAVLAKAADAELPDLRLTGIVIEPSRRIAIFALTDSKPLIRIEGENLSDWRIETISVEDVSLSGPAGTRTLRLKPALNLVRQHQPAFASTGPGNGAIAVPINVPGGPLAQAATTKSQAKTLQSGPTLSPVPARLGR
jgi:hypothetical protein